ncbi:MAG TPA: carboxypeptidase-like regulatory domain-containing protein [bacterium]|nr:carboxypeptidase-like regulatory domain-containing protein [bacterium]HPN45166.1 carboxypeptidase-like regulatory domain-containing protein [bacterium]
MKVKIKIIIIVGLLPIILNCWDKQSHDITRPPVPHYIFNGTTVGYNSGESLEGIIVELEATKMLYDIQFSTQTDTSDSSGHFSFDPVYPGYYTWKVKTDGCWLAKQKMEITHHDSSAIIQIPRLFYARDFKSLPGSEHPALAIYGSTAWCNEFWIAKEDTPPFITSDLVWVYKQSNKTWFADNYYISPFYHRNLTSMAFGREVVYACVAPDTLYIVNVLDCQLSGKYQLSQNITGVAYHASQNCIYTCSKNNLFRHETEQPINIVQSWNFNDQTLSAIAYYKGFYTFDNNSYLLKKYDTSMNIDSTFALIDSDSQKQIANIYDMSFDSYGQLWFTLPLKNYSFH